jgi:UDP-N-acetylmuramate dehydrogenase
MDIQSLQTQFPTLSFQENVSLSPLTYMKVGGPAKIFVEISQKQDLMAVCAFCFAQRIPFFIMGGASNVIFPDEGVDKLVIRNLTNQTYLNGNQVYADSGVITAVLAKKTADGGLSGLEYFVGVPGTIGGAIYNNSHFTATQLIGNYLYSVEVCTQEGKLEVWSREELQLAYDTSIFHHIPDVILSATFVLQPGNKEEIQNRIVEAAKKRATTQPIGTPSSGCMFKNPRIKNDRLRVQDGKNYLTASGGELEVPEGALKHFNDGTVQIAAGFLIDQAGLKKTTMGGAEVSEKHATYIINTGLATAKDVDALATLVEQKVSEKFGVKLEREVFFIH